VIASAIRHSDLPSARKRPHANDGRLLLRYRHQFRMFACGGDRTKADPEVATEQANKAWRRHQLGRMSDRPPALAQPPSWNPRRPAPGAGHRAALSFDITTASVNATDRAA
jgi:hypothetical protein